MDRVLRGDEGGFGDLVARYQPLVAAAAWRSGVHRDDIEDVVSEVFLKVYRNLGMYRPEHPFSTWLYRLALNHIVDRSRRARAERGRTEMPAQIADTAPGAGERVEEEERREMVRRALGELDPRYREAILLVHVEGRKVEEASRILGVPEGTVKTRLLRGRLALRRILLARHPETFRS